MVTTICVHDCFSLVARQKDCYCWRVRPILSTELQRKDKYSLCAIPEDSLWYNFLNSFTFNNKLGFTKIAIEKIFMLLIIKLVFKLLCRCKWEVSKQLLYVQQQRDATTKDKSKQQTTLDYCFIRPFFFSQNTWLMTRLVVLG